MALRLDGYIRVSRVGGREGEGYISPDVQRDAITAYASELGGEIVAWHDDQDFSGGNIERPGFQAAIERLRAGESDGVVVMRIDRFARSVADGASVVREIIARNQVFASCHERIDPRTPEGKYMLNSFLANAELFLDQAKANWWTAKSRAIARGAHIGPAPIGYEKIPKGEPRPGCLRPHPIYGPAMTELFIRASTLQYGDSALARWMTDRAPRAGGAPWNPSEVRRWLSNRLYLGEVRYGELFNAEAHEPLTTEQFWERCQREPGEQRRAGSPFLLSGLIRCAACRYAMGGQANGGAKGETAVYRCPRSTRGCPGPSVIVARRVEELVVEAVRKRRNVEVQERDERNPAEESILEEADEAEREVRAFAADTTARGLLGEESWHEALRIRVADREAKRAKRDRVLATRAVRDLRRESIDDLDRHDLRDLLQGVVRHLFVRRRRGAPASERVLIVWADDLSPIAVPGPHRAGPFEPIDW